MENKVNTEKSIFGLVLVVFLIFFLASYLFPEDLQVILKKISRLGPSYPGEGDLRTDTYTIPSSELEPGEVVGYRTYAQDDAGNWNSSDVRTFTVPTTTVQGYLISIDNVRTLNSMDNTISSVSSGSPYKIRADISNSHTSSRQMLIVIQIINPNNEITEDIRSLNTEVNSQDQTYFEASYMASDLKGTYTIQTYVWTDWASLGGTPLASPSSITFEVV